MFLPIGDTPNPRGTPYLNYALIAINIAVFAFISLPLMVRQADLNDPLLYEYLQALGVRGTISARAVLDQVSAYDLFAFRYGYRPAAPSLTTLFTAMFLHGGWMHLAGNMLFLWIFGDNVEHRLGRLGYLFSYLGTGAAATIFFAVFVPHSQVPLIGASGAISGVLGLYYFWFPRNQVKTFVFLFPFIMTTFLVPARLVLGFYLIIDNVLPFLARGSAGSGVAHGAHIGGFIAGLAGAFAIERLPQWLRKARMRPAGTDEEPRSTAAESGLNATERIVRNLRMGSAARAAGDYLRLDSPELRQQVPAEDVLAIGAFLLQQGDYTNSLSLYRRFVAERPANPLVARAYLGAGKAMIHHPRSIPAAYQYFLSALDVADCRETAEEARLHLRAIERLGEEDQP